MLYVMNNNDITTDTPLKANIQICTSSLILKTLEVSMFGFWKPNSPEYNRLKELAGKLKLAIEPDIRPLSDDLLSKEIIAKDTNWLMYSRYSSSSAKAAYLVKAVLKKVQKSPEDYHQVVKILKQRNKHGKKGHYKDIIRELGKPLPQPVPQQPWRAEDQDLSAVVRDAWKSMWMWCSLPVMVYSFILTIVIICILYLAP